MNTLQQHDQQQLADVDQLIGIDEAGRGCLAGPVTAGACVLGRGFFESSEAVELSAAINDSKQLSAQARAEQLVIIEQLRDQELLDFEVASGSVEEIAELNILGATRLAMRRAVEGLAARANGWELPLLAADGPPPEPAPCVPAPSEPEPKPTSSEPKPKALPTSSKKRPHPPPRGSVGVTFRMAGVEFVGN